MLSSVHVPQSPAHQRRLHIGLVSRPRTPYNSRAMTNEAEVVSALQTHLGPRADVRLLTFNGSLTQAMQDARRTDVLIGMHGAGAQLWRAASDFCGALLSGHLADENQQTLPCSMAKTGSSQQSENYRLCRDDQHALAATRRRCCTALPLWLVRPAEG